MNANEIIETEKQVILGTYTRPNFVITRGEGVYLYDSEGKRYLDFIAGISVNALGHGDKQTLHVLDEQAKQLWHCSNLYYTEPQVRLAKLLVENTFADKVFFGNSGAEAIEGAIKFARKWAANVKGEDSFEIIAFRNSFHGRTMGSLSATGQPRFWEDFAPMLPGFKFASYNDLDSVKELINDQTCAILVEPIQGEGGIYPAEKEFLQGIKDLCDEHNCLLIVDEIQCGLGRTGTFNAYEQYDIIPDMMTLAKPIAGGLPMGVVLLNDKIGGYIRPGNHGSTFGGGPLVASVAEHIVRRISEPGFLDHIRKMSEYLFSQLNELKKDFAEIVAVRGRGLMVGIELNDSPQPLIDACAENGLLVCKTGGKAFRMLPPLIIEKEHVDEAIEKLARAMREVV